MSKLKSLLLIIVAMGLQIPAWAQGGSTNSPYSRYGYGLLADRSISGGLGMGGLGYGLRKSNQINPMNPASYSAVDSLTFLFDVGVDMHFVRSEDEGGSYNYKNGNLKNINMLFPLGKGFAFSAGILPITSAGYEYGIPYSASSGQLGQVSYSGSGGLQQVYGGLAYKFGNFSLGANLGYLFGDVNFSYVVYPEGGVAGAITNLTMKRMHALAYTVGVQQVIPLNKEKSVVVGLSYSPKLELSGKSTQTIVVDTDTTITVSPKGSHEMAQSVGFGASLVNTNWTIGADVLWENWEDTKVFGVKEPLNDRFRYAVGAEFVPDARSRNFFNRVQYKAGAYYSNSYITTDNGVTFDELGLSVGLGLPVNKSLLNLSFNYVKVNPSEKRYLSEDHFKIALSFTFNETWFRKWRLH